MLIDGAKYGSDNDGSDKGKANIDDRVFDLDSEDTTELENYLKTIT